MKDFSLTYQGVILMVIGYIFQMAGVPIAQGALETTIATAIAFVGAIIALYGRWRKGDLTPFGFRQ